MRLVVLLIALNSSIAFCQKNDVSDLKGPVKSIQSGEFRAIDSSGIIISGDLKEGTYIRHTQYDESFNVIESQTLSGSMEVLFSYQYDEQGNMKKSLVKKGDSLVTETIHYRNDQGKLKESLEIVNSKDSSRTIYKYNDDEKLIDIIEYGSDGKEGNHFVNSYDKLGHQVGYSMYYNNELVFQKRTVFDADSNLIEMCNIDAIGQEVKCLNRKYNSENRMIEEIEQRQGEFYSLFSIEYDQEGNRTSEKIYDALMNLTDWNEYRYEDGNMVELKIMDGSGKTSRHELLYYDDNGNHVKTEYLSTEGDLLFAHEWKYEYDSQGNWIKKVMYLSNTAYYLTRREIEYYE